MGGKDTLLDAEQEDELLSRTQTHDPSDIAVVKALDYVSFKSCYGTLL